MIFSVSRRTDIPAFYSKWFYNRIKEGFVLVRNPMNSKQISRIDLNPELIDCIVFWTKNPRPMLKYLHLLNKYTYYFQFTLNSYDKTIEVNLPSKKSIINDFIHLFITLGKNRIIWRYDPILISDKFSKEYHYKWFEYLCKLLHPYTNKCVISFIDVYAKAKRNLKHINLKSLSDLDMCEISSQLSKIAYNYGLIIETCSEMIDFESIKIQHGKCIDDMLISQLLGEKIVIEKDPNQREICGCVKSIDIGEYNSCKHSCLYCYANFNQTMVSRNWASHDDESPILIGQINDNTKIHNRPMISYRSKQLRFFEE
ncbi:DUF1848 domain-containing protein [Pelotomaculum terephthalicicum JT]|uniref:DUF1848 domain-containing protein n=1 Tax=Candidatus Methanofastidiosum methylothiophilum TaxID=1705564 RepID=A0A150IWY4_9EURY|nr:MULTISPECIES: DUF1848 domain-containing protein [Pelotomaculum]KYC49174.1 MAG: hypothetical protein AMQ74_01470 [Candidatus Methanofastidiosum methylthiophilus]MCG9969932.1 DUF1848 domain-containing protein [Pelotomaculum terephthalicicum JT]OPX92318.1 MAG: hypothetical protein A4E54_00037 [Pelotomaculum sp. PtaB.Bin117]OPY60196.1 MAG: hypothetical protein A4E56_02843 [Pelotomaculum sp. PtaU1.Bin065]